MKVIIAGSRNITNYQLVEDAVFQSGFEVTRVVSGTARGVDRLGEQWARTHGVLCRKMPANWSRDGNQAGFVRNYQMALYADALVAVWDGKSNGTASMIHYMEHMSKPLIVVQPSEDGLGWEYHAIDADGQQEKGRMPDYTGVALPTKPPAINCEKFRNPERFNGRLQ